MGRVCLFQVIKILMECESLPERSFEVYPECLVLILPPDCCPWNGSFKGRKKQAIVRQNYSIA